MTNANKTPDKVMRRLGRVLAVTRVGMLAERVTRGFWPLWSLCFVVLAALMMGLHEQLSLEFLWTAGLVVVAAGLWFLWRGARVFAVPSRDEAMARLDATLPARPLQALNDTPAVGADDPASQAVWRVHQARMLKALDGVEAAEPDLKVSRLDPFGLRYVAVLALSVAFLFGSFAQVRTVGEMAQGGAAVLTGPSWEGWIEPPAYTGLPSLYLADQPEGELEVPEGSRVILRFYGEVGALTLAESVSARVEDVPSAADPEQDFTVARSGQLAVEGEGGRGWDIDMLADGAPQVAVAGAADVSARGEMSLPFEAVDDYEIVAGSARISLDLEAVTRRYGLAFAPESMVPIDVELPLPVAGGRDSFKEVLIEDFSKHPWAHLPVRISLSVEDAAGQVGASEDLRTDLPARRFFDPMAAAVIELRRDLLWSRDNGPRIAQLLRAISHRPEEGIFQDEISYLRLRTILRRLENALPYGLADAQVSELSEAMWELAILLEDGDLDDALDRMQRARDRLAEAMKNGASEEEIARLMQELREATQDYLRQLAQQQNREMEDLDPSEREFSENSMTLSQDDLQQMMDRIQELMEQGRMAEAMQALEEFQQMMENMQVTQGQGQGQQSAGEQAMEGLAETLREQQGLSDQAFRELQEQFNPGANMGQSQGNEGYSGGEGRGQAHDGTGEGSGEGQEGESGTPGALADRQQALRDQLDALRNGMPGQGTPEGDATAEALGRAGEAMDNAEDALRGNDLGEAIDQQAQAMEALREGMRNLGEQMANQNQGQGQEGRQEAQSGLQDPLGRSRNGRNGQVNGEELLQGEDVYRQARKLLDEIRRRAGEAERSEEERGYLRRLLDRF